MAKARVMGNVIARRIIDGIANIAKKWNIGVDFLRRLPFLRHRENGVRLIQCYPPKGTVLIGR